MENKRKQMIKECEAMTKVAKRISRGDFDTSIKKEEFKYLEDMAYSMNNISQHFSEHIKEISRVLSHLSVGDMTISLSEDTKYRGDFIPIKTALSKMISSLNETFLAIQQLVDDVDKVCEQVEQESNEVAFKNHKEVEEIKRLQEHIIKMQGQSKETEDVVNQSAKNMDEIRADASVGQKQIDQMLISMNDVSVATNNIKGIVELINSLSAQTNILSLNASIEAARAGEAGRGFAVVANEVRNLASQSAEAANHTNLLIQESMESVSETAKCVENTAEVFCKIHNRIDHAAGLSAEMTRASERQVEGLNYMASMMAEISDSVEENAAFAQESAESVVFLSKKTGTLLTLLEHYKLKGQYQGCLEANTSDEEALVLLEKYITKLATVENLEISMAEIQMDSNVECIYGISEEGIQITETIMNPELSDAICSGFKPCQKGYDHSDSKYFTRAIALQGETYLSHEYLSSATGGLCKTYSRMYERKGKKEVFSLDIKCLF